MTQLKRSLLIVDDIAANRELLARRFERSGFQITEAECGLRALELIRQQSFDLVLLDIIMPDLDGLEVLRRIRQQHSHLSLPVVMVTARSQGAHISEAFAAGANDFITKPVDFAVAFARVKALLGRKEAEEKLQVAYDALQTINESLECRVADRTAELERANEQLRGEIAERQRTEVEIRHLANHDALTGLANRVLLQHQLNQALTRVRESDESLAILFIDLDSFKSINDTLGHSIGDALLKIVALRLKHNLRESDKIARLGGDEFAVVHSAEDQSEGVAALAARLIDVIRQPCVVEGHQVVCGASIGIVVASSDMLDPEQLLKRADLAMYHAKADGRSTYRFFDPEMDTRAQVRRSLEVELRTAQLENAFDIFYQPIFDVRMNRVSSVEALLRWRHPRRGFIPPSEFIRLAEEIGIITPLGEWVLQQACADAVRWPHEIKVAVNISPVQFRNGGVVTAVINALKSSGLPARRLEVEITESLLLDNTAVNLACLNELRDLGIGISMDDFGTGYSSLNYLRTFRFDKIKMDQSFIQELAGESANLAIVRALAELGASLGIITTAEGVETEEQFRHVKAEGYAEVQGFLLSPPRPAHEIPEIITRLERAKETPISVRGDQTLLAPLLMTTAAPLAPV